MARRVKESKAGWRRVAGNIVRVPLEKWRRWRKRRHTLHQLRRLNHEQLKDIGLTPHDIDRFR